MSVANITERNINGFSHDVLPQDLVKSRIRDIGRYNDRIALKFDRHLDSAAVETHVKDQSDWIFIPKFAASRLREILR